MINVPQIQDVELIFDACSESNAAWAIPESIYHQFRQNQDLNYEAFEKTYQGLYLEEKFRTGDPMKNIWVYRLDACKPAKVIFYYPKKIFKQVWKIPVDIKIG